MTDRTSGPPKSVATTTALTSASTPDAVPGFRFSPLDVGGEAETRPSGETASDAAEVRGALLGERARAFLGVLALENGHAELRVETERLVLVQTLALGMVRRIAWTASGPFAAIIAASSSALSSAWPSRTTCPMRPISFASGALM